MQGSDSKVYVIAEIGVNHNGSRELAVQLIDKAKEAGADAVKFQTFRAENLVTDSAEKASYQKKSTHDGESQFAMLKKLEMSREDFAFLKAYCDRVGIEFMSTPFDLDAVTFLDELGMQIFKIPSGEITNFPILKKIGSLKKKVILSTGMSNLDEVKRAVEVIESFGTSLQNIGVLHCNTAYPTPIEHTNLRAMNTMSSELGTLVGLSDHTEGAEVAIAAVALGARVIEKHITLSKLMEGPDHRASMEPDDFASLVRSIRNVSLCLGSGTKEATASEKENLPIARKSIVASMPIKKGEKFSDANLTTKRPGTGLSPMLWPEIIGTHASRDFKPNELITQ